MDALWYEQLPDGMHDVLVGPQGGLFLAGFDSLRRICLVLYAPPFGQPLHTVTELPYRDYGRYTPTVLAARDRQRQGQLYVLLYLHPDNLGLVETSLYRVDPPSGQQSLLAAFSSPYWSPVALLPRPDGSVLVALAGAGPILQFACNDTACEATEPLRSAASNATGKAGLAEVGGRICLAVGSSAVLGTGGHVVCERQNGSLQSLHSLLDLPPHNRSAQAAADVIEGEEVGQEAAGQEAAGQEVTGPGSRLGWLGGLAADDMFNPSTLAHGADGALYAVSLRGCSWGGKGRKPVPSLSLRLRRSPSLSLRLCLCR